MSHQNACVRASLESGTTGVLDQGGGSPNCREDDNVNVTVEETNDTLEKNEDLYTWQEDKLEKDRWEEEYYIIDDDDDDLHIDPYKSPCKESWWMILCNGLDMTVCVCVCERDTHTRCINKGERLNCLQGGRGVLYIVTLSLH